MRVSKIVNAGLKNPPLRVSKIPRKCAIRRQESGTYAALMRHLCDTFATAVDDMMMDFECKANLSATFLLFGSHIAHVQRERDARERVEVDMEIVHESPGNVPARLRSARKNVVVGRFR